MRRKRSLNGQALILLLLLSVACGPDRESRLDLEAEARMIRERNQLWLAAESRKDLDSSLTFIAGDGIYQPADWLPLRGHDEIRTYLEAAFAMPMDTIIGGPERIEVAASGDLAYEVGNTRVVMNPAEWDTVFSAKYLVVWKKIGGEWKAVATSVSGHE